jgi:nitronate monooxygenase
MALGRSWGSRSPEKRMRIDELFGIDVPIVQAPMAGVQGSALAIAVANAGGLGSLPAALLDPSGLRRELAAIRSATSRPCNVNFFCHSPPAPDPARETRWRALLAPWYTEYGIDPGVAAQGPAREPFSAALLEVLAEFRPAVVSFHFGLPDEALLAPIRAWGARIVSSATTVEEGEWLQRRGIDAVIAQGLEAGGHRGHFLDDDLTRQMGTLALTRRLVRSLRVPVIAAGGIADAAGVRAALALGATGVQVGTAFLLCAEATTAPLHRAALSAPNAGHTALTNLFTGRPARGIVNRVMRELGYLNAEAPAFPLAGGALAPLRAAAERAGSSDFTPLWAGQNTAGCRAIPAAELLRGLWADGASNQ